MVPDGSWKVIDEISPRSKDSIVGVGERLACKLVATILRDRVSLVYLSIICLVLTWFPI